MFSALIKLLQYFKNLTQGGCLPFPSDISGGGPKQPPGLMFLKYCNNVVLLVHKTCLYILGYIVYTFNREVMMPLKPIS